jgi:ATP-dependent phosphoenolpyruvate carboxykinase
MLKPLNGKLLAVYDDVSITENGRVSYLVFHINNYMSRMKATSCTVIVIVIVIGGLKSRALTFDCIPP